MRGLVRFSLPCTGGFKKYHGSLEERRAALYASKRLDERSLWSEHILLQPLRTQSDKDCTLHLLLGEDFPEPWRSWTEAAIRNVPQIVPHWRSPHDHRAICRDVLLDWRDPTRAVLAEFRLEDDDAVAVDYVQQLRRNWRKRAPRANVQRRVALDHGREIVLEALRDASIKPHALTTQCWSAGLALDVGPDDEAIVMDFPHHKIWARVLFVKKTDSVMFIRGDHTYKDAKTPFGSGTPVEMPHEEITALIHSRFVIDIAAFQTEWRAQAS